MKINSTQAVNDQSLNTFIKQKHYTGTMVFPTKMTKGDIISPYSDYHDGSIKYKIISDCLHVDKDGSDQYYEYKVEQIGSDNHDEP